MGEMAIPIVDRKASVQVTLGAKSHVSVRFRVHPLVER